MASIIYPKCTEATFEEYITEYVCGFGNKRILKNQAINYSDCYINLPAPATKEECSDLAQALFGVPIDFSKTTRYNKNPHIDKTHGYQIHSGPNDLIVTGFYEVSQRYDDLCKIPLYKMWNKKFGQYDGIKPYLNTVFGKLGTGGTARASYGDFRRKYLSETDVRLRSVTNQLIEPFARPMNNDPRDTVIARQKNEEINKRIDNDFNRMLTDTDLRIKISDPTYPYSK